MTRSLNKSDLASAVDYWLFYLAERKKREQAGEPTADWAEIEPLPGGPGILRYRHKLTGRVVSLIKRAEAPAWSDGCHKLPIIRLEDVANGFITDSAFASCGECLHRSAAGRCRRNDRYVPENSVCPDFTPAEFPEVWDNETTRVLQ